MKRLVPLLAGTMLAGGMAAVGTPAHAAPVPAPLSITYVARSCDNYAQVMANKARNNIQESLRDLGPDSNYARSEAVSVAKEQAGTPAPPCKPLAGWRFSSGSGYTGKTAASLQLSTVTGLLRSDIVTQDSTPELDAAGNDTGRTLAGAVTVRLDAGELGAAGGNHLWVQGGTPSAPLNGMQEQYGFAALRCAQDSVNGDNVETVSFPAGARHMFCYYYAITPPPGAGQITVVKKVAPNSNGPGTFRFDGNISYADTNGDGINDFTLTASESQQGSQTFVRGETRAGDPPWTFQERSAPGWLPPTAPQCTQTNTEGGPGTSGITVATDGHAAITLHAGDHVTCVYTNHRTAGPGLLQKVSTGGVGTFDIHVGVPPGAPPIGVPQVVTTQEGVPVTVVGADAVVPGVYTLAEKIPAPGPTGFWTLPDAYCDGKALPVTKLPSAPDRPYGAWEATYDIEAPVSARCVFTNHFHPAGEIAIGKITEGPAGNDTGTFHFSITGHPAGRPAGPADATELATATTTAPDKAAAAHPDGQTSGPAATGLTVDSALSYTVQELLPAPNAYGSWRLVSADCGGRPTRADPVTASIEVRLTPEQPRAACRFTNRFMPLTTLDVAKTTTGDRALRPGAAELTLVCADGTRDRLAVAAGAATGSFAQRVFAADTTCTVAEAASGAGAGIRVRTEVTRRVDGGAAVPVALGVPFEVRAGTHTVVSVVNTLTKETTPPGGPSPGGSPPPPTTTPPTTGKPGTPGPGTPSGPAPSGKPRPKLPATGADLGPASAAAGMTVAGAVLLGAAGLTRRRQSRR